MLHSQNGTSKTMTTLELAASHGIVFNTETWLADFLRRHAAGGISPANDGDSLQNRLRAVTLIEIVRAIERADQAPGAPATIHLYQYWIASQPPGSAQLHLAWFNLGVAFSQAQDQPNAILAYQNALALRPDFHSAAANLGLMLESIGQPEAALRTWERAIQPNEARIILLNNRARLLEQV